MRPIEDSMYIFVVDGVVMDVIHMTPVIFLVAYDVLPVAALPDPALTLQHLAARSKRIIRQAPRKCSLDAAPTIGITGIAGGQCPDAMQMLRQDYHGVEVKRIFGFDMAKNLTQGVKMIQQQGPTPIS